MAVAMAMAFAWPLAPGAATAQTAGGPPAAPGPRVEPYKLETLEVIGSSRLTSDQLAGELGLVPGTPLDDELVMSTQGRLLTLGLFRSAILAMRRGSKPGWARLVIELEDEPTVLTDWALGGELAVTMTESNAAAAGTGQVPMDYRLGLIGRNLFGDLHRGSLMVDMDDQGWIRAGQFAYGLPRFAREAVQFDAELAVVDPASRYLDTTGFGGRGQGLWAQTLPGLGELQYGPAMYINRKPRFAMPGFPEAVAGPKIALYRETRLRSFFPGSGHQLSASLLLSPTETDDSVGELDLAKTWQFGRWLYATVDARLLAAGSDAHAMRGEARFDIPLGVARPGEDQAEIYLRLRGGQDIADNVELSGTAAVLGLRYHSSGFIAEVALKVTKTPKELTDQPLTAPGGSGAP